MTTRLVPRKHEYDIAFDGIDRGRDYVTDSDAARLEAVVDAAKEMRSSLMCETSSAYECPRGDCECDPCEEARDFDTALAALTEGRVVEQRQTPFGYNDGQEHSGGRDCILDGIAHTRCCYDDRRTRPKETP